jgi:hypothetical protein
MVTVKAARGPRSRLLHHSFLFAVALTALAATIDVARAERNAPSGMPSASPARVEVAPRAAQIATEPPSYGWPLRPFHRQHPVRGFFGDPRIGGNPLGSVRQFHFGVDVSAPDGTAVYATLSGTISIHPRHPDVVIVTGRSGVQFSYWHLVPAVRSGQRAVAYRTQVGRIAAGWGHVHFSEMRGGRYLNPLRPGAMGPFADHGAPTVRAVEAERSGRRTPLTRLRGSVDLVADVFDETPLPVPPPWNDKPVMPALVRWRLVRASGLAVIPWQTAIDFRRTIPPAESFGFVFARETRQNRPNRAGLYRVFLVHRLNTRSLRNGVYRVQVVAADVRGNSTRFGAQVQVANAG